jgi:hypothetical protein
MNKERCKIFLCIFLCILLISFAILQIWHDRSKTEGIRLALTLPKRKLRVLSQSKRERSC